MTGKAVTDYGALLKKPESCPCDIEHCPAYGERRPKWRGHVKGCICRDCQKPFPPPKPSSSLRSTAQRIRWLTVCEERYIHCGGRCEAEGFHAPTCDGTASPAGHHVLPRSKGGADTFDNCRMVHPDCHDRIHARPLAAKALGLLADPDPEGDAA